MFIKLEEFLQMVIVILLAYAIFLAPVAMVNVEIYASGDPEEYFYCATGTLAPPARYVGSGAVPVGDESYC